MKGRMSEEIIYSDFPAVISDAGKQMTYRELADESRHYAEWMEKRCLIFILCDHHMETVEFLYEMFFLRQVLLLLPNDINREFLSSLISIYKPQYIYCSKENGVANRFPKMKRMDTHVILKTDFPVCPLFSDLALLLCTSGTTSSSKLVRLSYDNLYYNAKYSSEYLKIKRHHRGISPLPLNHAYCLMFYFYHWFCGAAMLVTDKLVLSREFNQFYMRERANNFAGVPTVFKMLNKINFWSGDKTDYLHCAMAAGEQMSDADQRNMVSVLGEKFWIFYGQTECTGVVFGSNFSRDGVKLGTIGKPCPDVNFSLDATTGELIIESKSVSLGYARGLTDLAEGDINKGRLNTGDIAWTDGDGYVYLKGRMKRFVKISGKRISLDGLERYIRTRLRISEIACVGWDNDIVFFYSEQNPPDILQKIPYVLNQDLKIPNKFVRSFKLSAMPRNSVGKIQYERLKEMAQDGKEDIGAVQRIMQQGNFNG